MVQAKEKIASVVVSTRIEKEIYRTIRDIAAFESINADRPVTAQQLIRNALQFVYGDNERLRECFRRARAKVRRKR